MVIKTKYSSTMIENHLPIMTMNKKQHFLKHKEKHENTNTTNTKQTG